MHLTNYYQIKLIYYYLLLLQLKLLIIFDVLNSRYIMDLSNEI